MKKVPMTIIGAEQLREELNQLKFVARPKIIAAIAEARAHGDLKENAEYHAAKEQQSFLEGRIADIEGKLSNAQIIDVSKMQNDGRVTFGATITLVHVEKGTTVRYQLVGDDEADFKTGKVSVNSPIARAAIGKYEGDAIEVNAPGGDIEYEIDKVEYC
jgi:transcription elongation factor GreA